MLAQWVQGMRWPRWPGCSGARVPVAIGAGGHGGQVRGWWWWPLVPGAGHGHRAQGGQAAGLQAAAVRGCRWPLVQAARVHGAQREGGDPQRPLELCYRRSPGHRETKSNSKPIGSHIRMTL
jgi:hypothetical protein